MKNKLTLLTAIFALILVFTPNVKAEAAITTPDTPGGLGLYSQQGSEFLLYWNWDAKLNSYAYGEIIGYGYEVTVTDLKNKAIVTKDSQYYNSDFSTDNSKIYVDINNAKMKKQGFQFKVRSFVYDETYNKVYSNWSSEKLIIPRATVSKASLVKNNSSKVNIKFNKITGAKSYTIYLSTNGKKFTKVGTTTKTSYTISKKFTKYKDYYVYVAANKVKYKKKNYNSTNPTDKAANSYKFYIYTTYR